MSQNTSAVPMNIECFMDDKDVTYSMKRKDMETLAAPLLARVDATLKEILSAASKLLLVIRYVHCDRIRDRLICCYCRPVLS